MTKLLLIDSRVSDIDAILSSLTSDTEYIVFNYVYDTFDTIQSKINNTLTKQYTHVAIAQHKYNVSTYSMIEAMPPALLYDYDASGEKVGVSVLEPDLSSWQPFVSFLMWLKTDMGTIYIDLLACDLWSDLNWVYVIETLKTGCGLSIRASIDITGYGGDFILESDNVDLVGIYFTEAILNYKYSFVGNDFITLINTKSPWGIYSATEYSNVTNLLYEIRGNGRNATTSGSLTPGSATGNGATGAIKFLNGTTTQTITWPAGSIPATHTVALITRYTGASNRLRILTDTTGGTPINALFGHHTQKRGVSYYYGTSGGWLTQESSNVGTITNWLYMVTKTGGSTPNNVLVDGVASGVATVSGGVSGIMTINGQSFAEKSDFGFSYLMIWDQALTDAEMVIVSGQLAFYLSTGNPPPVLSGFQNILHTKRPWGIYRAIDWNSGTNTLPEARGITARNATKGGAGAVTYTASETGNGANGTISSISGITTTEMAWPAGSVPTTYTIAFITRYTGGTYNRILQGTVDNLLFGHWGGSGNRGVFYDKNQWINGTSYGTLTNWLAMVCKVGTSPNNCIVDGTSRGSVTSTAVSSGQELRINNGAYGGEDSNWAFSYLMIWDQAITDTEAAIVSNELLSYLGTGTLPATTGYVLNGYFTGPALATDTFTEYTSPFAAIVNWTIAVSNARIYIANQSTAWGYYPIAGMTQWMVIVYTAGTAGTNSLTQNIYFETTGLYALTYYTMCRPGGFPTNVITLGASISGTSQSSLVNASAGWELRTLNFTIASVGTQTLTFTTSYTNSASNASVFLTAINVTPVNVSLTAPGTPTLNAVTAGNQQLTVAFTPPASDGGSSITTYKYSLNSGALVNASTTTSPFTISGLAINTAYSVYIVATNAIGDSSNSSVISATTWNVPGAPTVSSVTGGNKQISIAFSAPASNGGTAITTYKYSLNSGAFVDAATTTSPIVVSSLSDNTSYSVVLRATSAVGDSASSNSVSGTTWNVPGAPTITAITEGNQQLSVAFTAPASNGGSAITTYKYSLNGGSFVNAATTTSPIVIPALTGGTSYSVVLRATTVVGDSVSSNSLSGTPFNVPVKPTISIQAGSFSIVVTAVTGSNGGRTITSYKYSTDGTTYSDTGSAILPFSISSLIPGEGYYVTVKATNSAGDSVASDPVYTLAGTIPDPATITSVVSAASETLYVYYADPEYTGYSAITDIKYSLNGGVFTSYGSDPNPGPLILTGLTNGTTYTVKIKTVNVVGDSDESNAVTETLSIVPHPPTLIQVSPGNQQLTLTFSGPVFTGYSSILYYMYSLNNGADVSLNTLSSPFIITGLTNGTSYAVKMRTVNRIGASAYSTVLTTVPRTTPSPPTITGLTALTKSILVTFTNGSDGGNAISNTKYSLNGQEYVAGNVISSPLLISNLTEGITYRISLVSSSAAGDSTETDVSSVYLPYTYNYENPLSIDSNGEVFVMTLRNELNNTYHYKYSYDGLNWTAQSLPTSALTAYNPYNVKWTGNQFLISGNVSSGGSNALLRSYDGVDFSISKTTTTNQIFDLETNLEYRNTITFPINTTLVLGGVSNDTIKIAYSYDGGSSWLPSTDSSNVFPIGANDAIWNGKIWVAVGEGVQPLYDTITQIWVITEQTGNTIATSEDGKTWIGRGKHMFSIRGNAVDWSRESNLIVAVGDGSQNSIAYSHDGTYWLGCGKSMFETGNSIKWNGQIWVAGGTVQTITQKSLAYSFDGKTWEQPVQIDLFQTSTNTVSWNGSQWVAYGTDPTYNVATSNDGITWNMINDVNYASPTPFYNGTQYLKIENNQVRESPDGTTWVTSQSVANMSVLKKFAWNRSNEGVPFIQPISLAFGEGANTIGYSYDGINWTGLGKSIFTVRGNNGVWNGKIWVAVGTGTHWCAYSYDGLYWDGLLDTRFTEAYDIAWNGHVFVAVGEGDTRIAISSNGINWSSILNSTSIFTEKATAIKWTGQAWIAYGSGGNTTATSLELYGTVWTVSSKKNMAVTDLSSAITLGYGTDIPNNPPSQSAFYVTTENSGQEGYRALDDDMETYLYSPAPISISPGILAELFFNNAPGSMDGELMIMDASQLVTIKSYLLALQLYTLSNMLGNTLREWALVAFPGDDTWENLFTTNYVDLIHRGSFESPPNTPDNKFVQYINIPENTTAYRIYILILSRSYDTHLNLIKFDMFYESGSTNTISRFMKPVVTRNSVLHPNTVMPYYHTVYLLADLSNNTIENNQVPSPHFMLYDSGLLYLYKRTINSVFYGTNNQIITSSGYDGQRLFVTTIDGQLIYMTNDQANTYANFDVSFNNTTITTNLPTIYTSCYNRNFILLGGSGNSVITYNTMDANVTSWYSTNANEIFTSVYGLASNPGYGHVYVPNALYLNAGDKLSVVTPKSINQTTTSNTAITIDLNKPYL